MSEKKPAENQKQSLFLVKSAQHNTQSIELYLERRGYSIQTENQLKLAQEKIDTTKPQFLFIALDHEDNSIKDFIKKNQENKNIVVIIFATSTIRADIRKLITFNSSLKMFPPISGPTIQRTILKREKNNFGNTNKGYFIAHGQRFNDLKHKIQPLTKEDIDFNSYFDTVTDLTLELPAAQFSKEAKIKISDGQKQILNYKFDSKIANELTQVVEASKEKTTDGSSGSAFCMLVRSIDSSGLILLHSQFNLNLDDVEFALLTWAEALVGKYDKSDIGSSIYHSNAFPIHLNDKKNPLSAFAEKAAFQKDITVDEKATVLSFFDMQNNPFDLAEAHDPNYFTVDHNCLYKAPRIDFELFFRLVANKKMIKLFKVGASLSDKEIMSIHEKKKFPLLIDVADELNWYKYGVESYLEQV